MLLVKAYIWKQGQEKQPISSELFEHIVTNNLSYKGVFDESYLNSNLYFEFIRNNQTTYWYHTVLYDMNHRIYVPSHVRDEYLIDSFQGLSIDT
jgi:hypothetical protein